MQDPFTIDPKIYDLISKEIHSDTSPVGIDAKKTHILILARLEALARQMDRIEKKLDRLA